MRTTEKDYCGYDIKGRDNFNGYHGNHDNELLFACLQKLGKIEDLMEKYGVEDIETLEKILEVQKFLVEHDYSTLPRKDFDELFAELKKCREKNNK